MKWDKEQEMAESRTRPFRAPGRSSSYSSSFPARPCFPPALRGGLAPGNHAFLL